MSCLQNEHFFNVYVDGVVVKPIDPDQLKKYKGEMAKTKRMILTK